MRLVGKVAGWTVYEHEQRYFVRYEQAAAYTARTEPSISKQLLDFVLREDGGDDD